MKRYLLCFLFSFVCLTSYQAHAALQQSPYVGDDERKENPGISSRNFPGSFDIGLGMIPFSFFGLAPSASFNQFFFTNEDVFGLGLRLSVPATFKIVNYGNSSSGMLLGVTGQFDIIFWRKLVLSGTLQYHNFFNGSDGLSLGGRLEFFFAGKCRSDSGISLEGLFVVGAASNLAVHLHFFITSMNSVKVGVQYYFEGGYSNPFRDQILILITNTIHIGW
jgi:hypothetical protein